MFPVLFAIVWAANAPAVECLKASEGSSPFSFKLSETWAAFFNGLSKKSLISFSKVSKKLSSKIKF